MIGSACPIGCIRCAVRGYCLQKGVEREITRGKGRGSGSRHRCGRCNWSWRTTQQLVLRLSHLTCPCSYLLLCFCKPTPKPIASAKITTSTNKKMKHIRLHPPLWAIYLLFRTSVNFSPFGPVTSQKLYWGGGFSKLCLGGLPKAQPRLDIRFVWAFSGTDGATLSSAMTESLASRSPTKELARLRLEPLAEWRGKERSMKSIVVVVPASAGE
jgi:hypothetical protein